MTNIDSALLANVTGGILTGVIGGAVKPQLQLQPGATAGSAVQTRLAPTSNIGLQPGATAATANPIITTKPTQLLQPGATPGWRF